jgi:hypothetical protein
MKKGKFKMFRSMSIGRRASLGFAVMGLLLVFLGLFSLYKLSTLRAASEEIDSNWLLSINHMNQLSGDIARIRLESMRLLVNHDSAARQHSLDLIAEARQDKDKVLADYRRLILSSDEQQHTDELRQALDGYLGYVDQLLGKVRQDDNEGALHLLNGSIAQQGAELSKRLNALIDLNRNGAAAAAQRAGGAVPERPPGGRRGAAAQCRPDPAAGLATHPQHCRAAQPGRAGGADHRQRRPQPAHHGGGP